MSASVDQLLNTLTDATASEDALGDALEQIVAQAASARAASLLDVAVPVAEPRWRRAAERVERSAQLITDADVRAMALVLAGAVWETRLLNADQAVNLYQAAFRLAPRNFIALERARRIYVAADNLVMARRIVGMELQVCEVPVRRGNLLVESALLARRAGEDEAAVTALLKRAVEEDPACSRARALLDGDQTPDFATRMRELEVAAGRVQGADRARVLVEMARLADEQGGASGVGPGGFLDVAIELAPTLLEAHRMRVRLRSGAGAGGDGLFESLEAVAALTEDASERIDALCRLAEARLRAQQYDGAEVAAERALEEQPKNERALTVLARVAVQNGDWAGAASALDRALALTGRGAEQLPLLREAAILHWRYMNDVEGAEPYFRRIRQAEPHDESAASFYAEYHGAHGDFRKQIAALRAMLEKASGEDATQLLERIASVAEHNLNDVVMAIDAHTDILKLHPRHAASRAAIRRLLRAGSRWNRLLEVLKADAEELDAERGPEWVSLQAEIAELYESRLNVPARAIATWNAVAEADPDNERAFAALAANFEKGRRWADLARLIEGRAARTADPDASRELLLRAVALYRDELGNPKLALQTLWILADRDPGDPEVIALEEQCLRATGDWPALVALFQRKAAATGGAEALGALNDAAQVAREHLLPIEQLNPLRRLVEATEYTDDEALDAYLDVCQKLERHDEHLAAIRRRLEAPGEPRPDLAALMLQSLRASGAPAEEVRAAAERLLDATSDPAEQIAALRVQFELDPHDAAVGDQLAEMLLSAGDRNGAVSTLAQLVGRVGEAEGNLYRQRLVDTLRTDAERLGEAFGWAAELFESERDQASFNQASDLAALTRHADDWADTLTVALSRGELDEDLRVNCLRTAAELLAVHSTRWSEAIALLEQLRAVDDSDTLLKQLAGLYERAQDWASWVGVAEALVDVTYDPSQQLALLSALVSRYETQLGDRSSALDSAVRWSELGGDSPAMAAVERLAAAEAAWGRLAAVLETRIDARPGVESVDLRLRLAELLRGQLADVDGAIDQLRRVVDLQPGHGEALIELDSIFMQLERWDDLVDIVEQRIAAAEGPDDAMAQINRLVVLHEHARADLSAAAAAAQRLVDAVPLDGDARETLFRLLVASGDLEGAVVRLNLEVGLEDSEPAIANPRLVLARMLVHDLGRHDDAVAHLAVLLERGDELDDVAQLLRICGESGGRTAQQARELRLAAEHRLGDARRLAEALGARAQDVAPADRAALVAEQIALLSGPVGDAPAALSVAIEALTHGVYSPELIEQIVAVGSEAGAWSQLVEALTDAAAVAPDAATRAALLHRAAHTAESGLADSDAAIALYRELADGGDAEASDRLEALLERAGRAEELAELADQRALHGEPAERGRNRLAALRRAVAAGLDSVDASGRVESIAAGASDDLLLLAELADFAAELDAPAAAAAVLVILAGAQGRAGAPAAESWLQVASLRAGELADPDGAVDAGRAARDASPTADVLDRLVALFASLNAPEELAPTLAAKAAALTEPAAKAEALCAAAQVYEEQLDDPHAAIDLLRRSWALVPGDRATRRALARLLESCELWEEFAAFDPYVLEPTATAVHAASLGNRARVLADKLDRPRDAVALLRRLFADAQVGRVAAESALRIAVDGAVWDEARGLVEHLLETVEEPSRRAQLLLQLATIVEGEGGDGSDAAAYVRAAFDADPTLGAAQDALEIVAERDGDTDTLSEVADARLRAATGARRAELLVSRLADESLTAERRRVLLDDLAGSLAEPLAHDVALTAISLFFDAGLTGPAGWLLGRIDADAPDMRRDRHRVHHLRGRLAQSEGRTADAIAAYREAMNAPTVLVPNLLALAGLLADDGQWSEALNIYLTVLLHQSTLTAAARVDLYYRIGIARMQTNDTSRAADMFRRALAVDPNHEASRDALAVVSA